MSGYEQNLKAIEEGLIFMGNLDHCILRTWLHEGT